MSRMCEREEKKTTPTIGRTILSSALASLIVAVIINFVLFVSIISKVQVELEHSKGRLALLENELRDHLKESKQFSIDMARQTTALESIVKELIDIRKDQREVMRERKQSQTPFDNKENVSCKKSTHLKPVPILPRLLNSRL